MSNWLHMRDFVTLTKSDPDKKYLFECKDSKSETGHSLLVTCESTHAGINNGNARWYRPDKQQSSTHTWLPKGRPGRPVLVKHDKDGEVQGRVKKARYVDLSYQYFGELPNVKNLAFYDAKRDSKLNVFDSVDWVMRNLQGKPDYKGLGFIELGMNITCPDAIAKVQREEFATVSVGFRTDQAICSICHTDWADDDKCEHASDLGGTVDGKPVFLISGNFQYDEVSFVNFPADPWGIVTSKESISAVADSLRNRYFFLGLPQDRRTQILQHSDGLLMVDSVNVAGSDIHPAESPEEEATDMDLTAIQAEIGADALTKERALALRVELEDAIKEKGVKRVLNTLNAKIRSNKWDGVPVLTKESVESRIAGAADAIAALPEADRAAFIEKLSTDAETFGLTFSPAAEPIPAEDKAAAPAVAGETDAEVLRIVNEHYADAKEESAADGKAAAGMLDTLHKFYHTLGDKNRPYFRYAMSALMEHWSTGSMVDYYKKYLLKGDDAALVTKEEFDTLQAGFESAEADLKSANDSIAALGATNQALVKSQKKNLATLLVYGSVMTGDASFKNLSADKMQAEIDLREKRTLVSLTDSLSDLMKKLPGLDLSQVSKPSEGVKEVKDSATVKADDGPLETAKPTEVEPIKLSRWTDSTTALRLRSKK